MEIYKEKEESDTVSINLDPEKGIQITIDPEKINFNLFDEINDSSSRQSIKAKTFEKAHSSLKKQESDLEELNHFTHPMENSQDQTTLGFISDELEEALISVEELLDFLDSNEEEIDV